MKRLDFFVKKLQQIEELKRTRTLQHSPSAGRTLERQNRQLLNFSSNDYLGLASDPRPARAAADAALKCGSGATASRLVCGSLEIHRQLEQEIADWKKTEAALLFNSGFQASCGIIPAIAERHSLIFSDKLNHASIIDGIKLSGATHKRYRHCDTADLARLLEAAPPEKRKIIISESLFSMDGDTAPLEDIRQLAERFDALLYIDDAHGSGTCGSEGRGPAAAQMERIDIYLGTFGKALGGFGGYVACSQQIRDYLVNTCRSFIYTTALPPAVAAANLEAVRLCRGMNEERRQLQSNIASLRNFFKEHGLQSICGDSPIVPLITGSESDTLKISRLLLNEGILAVAIRPPTVPADSSRIRFTLSAQHSEEDMQSLFNALKKVMKL